ncbi:MAG: DUF58 domain-containing protein [Alphaproteobacteria bacterium]
MAALSDRIAAADDGPRLLDEAFSPAVQGALERVRMRARHASGERPGHTPVRGRSDPSGTEVKRHTAYAPGDDLRRVDWAAFARLGELLTRRYVAEREVPVWLVLDASASMGPRGAGSKLDLACAIAAVVGSISLSGGDRLHVAALPGDAKPRQVGPLRGRQALSTLRSFLSSLEPAGTGGEPAAGLATLLRGVRRGLVFLVSDFLFEEDTIGRALDAIGRGGCEGKVVQVLSREDLEPSWLRDRDSLVDVETGETLRIEATPAVLARYSAALEAHVAALAAAAQRRAMMSSLTVTGAGLRAFLREELPRLGLRLVR